MKINLRARVLAAFLSVAVFASFLPMAVFANEVGMPETSDVSVSSEVPEDAPESISPEIAPEITSPEIASEITPPEPLVEEDAEDPVVASSEVSSPAPVSSTAEVLDEAPTDEIASDGLYTDYDSADIAVINALITAHSISLPKFEITHDAPPEEWKDYVEWDESTPKRITGLTLGALGFVGALEITGLDELTKLDITLNPELLSLKVTELPALKELNCGSNGLTSLTLTTLPALKKLSCANNKLTDVDLSTVPTLTSLDCQANNLSNLNLTGLALLEHLDYQVNSLSNVALTSLTSLTYLACGNNGITALDLSNNSSLKKLNCVNNNIASLDLSLVTSLTHLYATSNKLSILNLASVPYLVELACDSNELTVLDVASATSLTYLNCSQNKIESLDLTPLTSLTSVSCDLNDMSSLNLPNAPLLRHLSCSANKLASLNLAGLTSLKELYCHSNNLTDLGLSGLHSLSNVNIGLNPINKLTSPDGKTMTVSDSLGVATAGIFARYSGYEPLTKTATLSITPPNGKIFKLWQFSPAVAFVDGTSETSPIVSFTLDKDVSITPTYNVPVTGVSLSSSAHSMKAPGEVLQLTATVLPANATNNAVTWVSSNAKVASVSATGLVTGVGMGTATITSTTAEGGFFANCIITVEAPLATSVKLDITSNTLKVKKSITLKATVAPTNAANKTVTFTSNKPTIATVNSKTGKVLAKAVGTAVITVKTSNGKTAKCTIKVLTNIVEVTKVSLNAARVNLSPKKSYVLRSAILPANATTKTVVYTSNRPHIASVNSKTGKVVAQANGTAIITAKSNNKKTVRCTVVVSTKVTKVVLNAYNLRLPLKGNYALKANVVPATSNNKRIIFKSSNNRIATVSAKGVVKAHRTGIATITATSAEGGKVRKCKVIVLKTAIKKVTLSKTKATLEKNSRLNLKIKTTPSSAKNITTVWTSNNPKVATISAKGQVRAINAGRATIIANVGGRKVRCVITVR